MTLKEFEYFDLNLEQAADLGMEVEYLTAFIEHIRDGYSVVEAVDYAKDI